MDLDAMNAEANAFAMELLMPEAWLRADAAGVDICDDKAVEKLAKKYRVSASVMAYRLGELGPATPDLSGPQRSEAAVSATDAPIPSSNEQET